MKPSPSVSAAMPMPWWCSPAGIAVGFLLPLMVLAAMLFGTLASWAMDLFMGMDAVHLDRIGHTGPRLLIHADLGSVEWRDSLPTCERLAARLDDGGRLVPR